MKNSNSILIITLQDSESDVSGDPDLPQFLRPNDRTFGVPLYTILIPESVKAALADQQTRMAAKEAQIAVLKAHVTPEVAAEAEAANAAVLSTAGLTTLPSVSQMQDALAHASRFTVLEAHLIMEKTFDK